MRTFQHQTPAGTLTTIVDEADAVRAAGFTDDPEVLAVRMKLSAPPPVVDPTGPVDRAVRSYLGGDLTALDDLVVEQDGTAFQQRVWQALRDIPAGQTASYAHLAGTIGRGGATRAVGSACGRNLVTPFVPCHRAVRTDGSMGGYYYGLAVKDWLLAHETGQSLGHGDGATSA